MTIAPIVHIYERKLKPKKKLDATTCLMQTIMQPNELELSYNPCNRDFLYPMNQDYMPKDYESVTLTQKLLLSAKRNKDFMNLEEPYAYLKSNAHINKLQK